MQLGTGLSSEILAELSNISCLYILSPVQEDWHCLILCQPWCRAGSLHWLPQDTQSHQMLLNVSLRVTLHRTSIYFEKQSLPSLGLISEFSRPYCQLRFLFSSLPPFLPCTLSLFSFFVFLPFCVQHLVCLLPWPFCWDLPPALILSLFPLESYYAFFLSWRAIQSKCLFIICPWPIIEQKAFQVKDIVLLKDYLWQFFSFQVIIHILWSLLKITTTTSLKDTTIY